MTSKRNAQMKRAMMRLTVASACSLMAALPALACFTVEVENQSSHDLEIIWRADGCGAIFDGHLEVCHHKALKRGDSESYDYNWGATGPVVIARDSHKRSKGKSYTEWSYTYHDGKFESEFLRGTPPHCHEHYTIHFTDEDWS